jgi:hypothetical protein
MAARVVGVWPICVQLLGAYEAVGSHWLTAEEFPESVQIPFFGGNFWWARSSVLVRAGMPDMATRWHAEAWLGMGNPSPIYDFHPGWPTPDNL